MPGDLTAAPTSAVVVEVVDVVEDVVVAAVGQVERRLVLAVEPGIVAVGSQAGPVEGVVGPGDRRLVDGGVEAQPLAGRAVVAVSVPVSSGAVERRVVRVDGQAPLPLTVAGTGSVSADVPGLLCAASCTSTWNSGQRLVLTATPASGAKFVRWGGACSGTATCSVTVGSGTAVSALFAPAAFRLSVRVAGRDAAGAVR